MNIVKDRTTDGKCSGCGDCCGGVLPLSRAEISRIKAYVAEKGIKEQKRVVYHDKMDATCPFRDETTRKCLIYDVRPDICRVFMCNREPDEIDRVKMDMHKRRDVVYMRSEFYGNTELEDYVRALNAKVFEALASIK